MRSRYALIAIGYNRVLGIERLLNSLEKAFYDEPIDLIISIDNSGTDSVENSAKQFIWSHGQKRIITYPKRQGLRNHVLKCGDLLEEYDAVAVFEDDIIASNGFFQFMKSTVEKYKDDENIAGISLYNHLINVNRDCLFEPAYCEYDVFFMQFAQSWGQVWMKEQWIAFKEWYQSHDEELAEQESIPSNVSHWPNTSWLKYHIKYCIETNKYFVYPYKSLTTCFSDVGQHNRKHNNLYQVPLLYGVQTDYRFPDLQEAPVVYDAFFERVISEDTVIGGIESSRICVDLYASRTGYLNKRYVLSTRALPFKVICSFGMELRPIEMNILEGIQGNDIFLYDTEILDEKKSKRKEMSLSEFQYRWRLQGKTKLLTEMVFKRIISVVNK